MLDKYIKFKQTYTSKVSVKATASLSGRLSSLYTGIFSKISFIIDIIIDLFLLSERITAVDCSSDEKEVKPFSFVNLFSVL
jgi:hypothetical protein